jgi:hypothetical protein
VKTRKPQNKKKKKQNKTKQKQRKKNKAYLLNIVGKVRCNGKKFLLDLQQKLLLDLQNAS